MGFSTKRSRGRREPKTLPLAMARWPCGRRGDLFAAGRGGSPVSVGIRAIIAAPFTADHSTRNEHRGRMNYPGGPVADPAVLARLATLLAREWDPAAVVRLGLRGGDDFYREQAIVVAGMVDAGA